MKTSPQIRIAREFLRQKGAASSTVFLGGEDFPTMVKVWDTLAELEEGSRIVAKTSPDNDIAVAAGGLRALASGCQFLMNGYSKKLAKFHSEILVEMRSSLQKLVQDMDEITKRQGWQGTNGHRVLNGIVNDLAPGSSASLAALSPMEVRPT